MGLTYVQGNSICNTGSDTLVLPYTSANTAGHLGVAFCFCQNGEAPSAITDTNGNTWCPIIPSGAELGQINCYVCASLKAGANSVSAVFPGVALGGSPNLHILEYAYTGPALVSALQSLPENFVSFTIYIDYDSYSGQTPQSYSATMICGLYDQSGNSHSWEPSGGYLRTYTKQSNGNTAAVGDVTTVGFRPATTWADPDPLTNVLPFNIEPPLCAFMVVD
jgi:hypothetical protein